MGVTTSHLKPLYDLVVVVVIVAVWLVSTVESEENFAFLRLEMHLSSFSERA